MIFVDLMGKYTFVEALKIGIASFCERYPALHPYHMHVSQDLYAKLDQLSQFPSQAGLIHIDWVTTLPEQSAPYYFARILTTLVVSPACHPQIDELLIIYGKEKPPC